MTAAFETTLCLKHGWTECSGNTKKHSLEAFSLQQWVWQKCMYHTCANNRRFDKECGKKLKGNYPTNLKKMHHTVLKATEEAENVSKKKNQQQPHMAQRSNAQLSLQNSLKQRNSYSESSTQYKAITRQLAILWVSQTLLFL